MIVYVDSSAVVPLIKIEDTSEELTAYLDELLEDGHLLVAGRLLETEVKRAANRQGIDSTAVQQATAGITLVQHLGGDFTMAGSFPDQDLGSLDALHLATALRIGADCMITMDHQLEASAEAAGIPVLDTSVSARTLPEHTL